jgi:hypothetical protein
MLHGVAAAPADAYHFDNRFLRALVDDFEHDVLLFLSDCYSELQRLRASRLACWVLVMHDINLEGRRLAPPTARDFKNSP